MKNKSRGNNKVEEEEKSFAKEESKNYDDISNSFNTDGSDYSTRVIQFDESQNKIVGNIKKKSALEMVDLRPKANEQFREFKPSGTVNKSQKKREKAKAKKLKKKEMKAIEEQKAREKTMEAAKKKAKSSSRFGDNASNEVITPDGKKLVKKTVSKKKVTDEKGNEWEVVDQRKSTIVEESSSDDNSDLD